MLCHNLGLIHVPDLEEKISSRRKKKFLQNEKKIFLFIYYSKIFFLPNKRFFFFEIFSQFQIFKTYNNVILAILRLFWGNLFCLRKRNFFFQLREIFYFEEKKSLGSRWTEIFSSIISKKFFLSSWRNFFFQIW